MKNRKAFIEQIMIWFLVTLLTLGFLATISDNKSMRIKYYALKDITKHAALAAAHHYNKVDKDTDNCESVATNVVSASNYADEVTLNYTWDVLSDPNTVTATIASYTHDNFWWRFFGWDEVEFTNIYSIAKIIPEDQTVGDDVAPIGVNGCPLDLNPGDVLTLDLSAHNLYDPNDDVSFYALSDKHIDPNFNCAFGHGDAQASFTQFKQIIDDIVKDKINDDTTFDIETEYKPVANVCDDELTSNTLANDLKQSSQSFGSSFPVYMSIIVLGCAGTDGNNLVYEKIIPIKVTAVDYVKKTHFKITFEILQSPGGSVQLVE